MLSSAHNYIALPFRSAKSVSSDLLGLPPTACLALSLSCNGDRTLGDLALIVESSLHLARGLRALECGNTCFDPLFMSVVAELLRRSRGLRRADLRGNVLVLGDAAASEGGGPLATEYATVDAPTLIGRALRGKRQLRYVNVSNCNLGDDGAMRLLGALCGVDDESFGAGFDPLLNNKYYRATADEAEAEDVESAAAEGGGVGGGVGGGWDGDDGEVNVSGYSVNLAYNGLTGAFPGRLVSLLQKLSKTAAANGSNNKNNSNSSNNNNNNNNHVTAHGANLSSVAVHGNHIPLEHVKRVNTMLSERHTQYAAAARRLNAQVRSEREGGMSRGAATGGTCSASSSGAGDGCATVYRSNLRLLIGGKASAGEFPTLGALAFMMENE